jgi:hypothetical protein
VTVHGGSLSSLASTFHFVYQAVSGNFSIVARVSSVSGNAVDGSAAGLMVMDALATPARLFHADVTAQTQPCWIRLIDRGGLLTAFTAPDSNGSPNKWKSTGPAVATATGMIYAGLFVVGPDQKATTVVIDHVTLTANTAWQIDNGTYILSPESAQNMALAVTADHKVQLAESTDAESQQWLISRKGKDSYAIQPVTAPTLSLDVANGNAADGTLVDLAPDTASPRMRWKAVLNDNGTCTLAPLSAATSALDDFGGNGTSQATIDIWQRMAADPHTEWLVTPAP